MGTHEDLLGSVWPPHTTPAAGLKEQLSLLGLGSRNCHGSALGVLLLAVLPAQGGSLGSAMFFL